MSGRLYSGSPLPRTSSGGEGSRSRPKHGRELPETIAVHTVELAKYNLSEATISRASAIQQWVFFLLHASRYEANQLRGPV